MDKLSQTKKKKKKEKKKKALNDQKREPKA